MKPTTSQIPIRVMLVDDHAEFRRGVAGVLEGEPAVKVVAEASDRQEAVDLFRRSKPDLVLMDLRMPRKSGVEATLAIRTESPQARIIVLTSFDADEDVQRALQAGAECCLLKDISSEALTAAICAASAGAPIPSTHAVRPLGTQRPYADLSPQETALLKLLVKGWSNRELGAQLSVSDEAVNLQLQALFAKLDVQNRTEAAGNAIRHGVVTLS